MTKKILFFIIVAAFLIRVININYPPLLWDEASIGYNAYSILKTARDEYGQLLPAVFKSFGDYKPGLYIYLSVPFVAIFGLNSLSVRLPSVILGTLLPLLVYLLILKLSPGSKKTALITAALIAFNPWNIHFSRGAWETNVLLFELVLAALLFLNKKLILSSLIFAATLYTYQGGKIYTPLIILILYLVTRTKIFSRQSLLKFILPLFIFSLPILLGLLTSSDANRLSVFALWNYHRPEAEVSEILLESNSLNYTIFHNDLIFFGRNFLTRYFNHFSPRFLMFEGDWQVGRHGAPYLGMLLFPTFFFFIIGLIKSLNSKSSTLNLFFLLFLIIGPIPSALTRDIIQPVRCLPVSLPILYFAAVGILFIISKIKRLSFIVFLFTIYILSFVYYQDLYYNHMVKVKPDHWLYGYRQAAKYAVDHGQGKSVTFTDFYGQPYIYYLFYSKYNPADYQAQSSLTTTGLDVGKVEKIDNLNFTGPNFSHLASQPQQIIIISYDEVLRQGIDSRILIPLSPVNGHSSFYAYETD